MELVCFQNSSVFIKISSPFYLETSWPLNKCARHLNSGPYLKKIGKKVPFVGEVKAYFVSRALVSHPLAFWNKITITCGVKAKSGKLEARLFSKYCCEKSCHQKVILSVLLPPSPIPPINTGKILIF